jgi:hypothetical protein
MIASAETMEIEIGTAIDGTEVGRQETRENHGVGETEIVREVEEIPGAVEEDEMI